MSDSIMNNPIRLQEAIEKLKASLIKALNAGTVDEFMKTQKASLKEVLNVKKAGKFREVFIEYNKMWSLFVEYQQASTAGTINMPTFLAKHRPIMNISVTPNASPVQPNSGASGAGPTSMGEPPKLARGISSAAPTTNVAGTAQSAPAPDIPTSIPRKTPNPPQTQVEVVSVAPKLDISTSGPTPLRPIVELKSRGPPGLRNPPRLPSSSTDNGEKVDLRERRGPASALSPRVLQGPSASISGHVSQRMGWNPEKKSTGTIVHEHALLASMEKTESVDTQLRSQKIEKMLQRDPQNEPEDVASGSEYDGISEEDKEDEPVKRKKAAPTLKDEPIERKKAAPTFKDEPAPRKKAAPAVSTSTAAPMPNITNGCDRCNHKDLVCEVAPKARAACIRCAKYKKACYWDGMRLSDVRKMQKEAGGTRKKASPAKAVSRKGKEKEMDLETEVENDRKRKKAPVSRTKEVPATSEDEHRSEEEEEARPPKKKSKTSDVTAKKPTKAAPAIPASTVPAPTPIPTMTNADLAKFPVLVDLLTRMKTLENDFQMSSSNSKKRAKELQGHINELSSTAEQRNGGFEADIAGLKEASEASTSEMQTLKDDFAALKNDHLEMKTKIRTFYKSTQKALKTHASFESRSLELLQSLSKRADDTDSNIDAFQDRIRALEMKEVNGPNAAGRDFAEDGLSRTNHHIDNGPDGNIPPGPIPATIDSASPMAPVDTDVGQAVPERVGPASEPTPALTDSDGGQVGPINIPSNTTSPTNSGGGTEEPECTELDVEMIDATTSKSIEGGSGSDIGTGGSAPDSASGGSGPNIANGGSDSDSTARLAGGDDLVSPPEPLGTPPPVPQSSLDK